MELQCIETLVKVWENSQHFLFSLTSTGVSITWYKHGTCFLFFKCETVHKLYIFIWCSIFVVKNLIIQCAFVCLCRYTRQVVSHFRGRLIHLRFLHLVKHMDMKKDQMELSDHRIYQIETAPWDLHITVSIMWAWSCKCDKNRSNCDMYNTYNWPFYSCVLSYMYPAMNASEAGGDLALIQTSLLFSCKCQLVKIRTTWFAQ